MIGGVMWKPEEKLGPEAAVVGGGGGSLLLGERLLDCDPNRCVLATCRAACRLVFEGVGGNMMCL